MKALLVLALLVAAPVRPQETLPGAFVRVRAEIRENQAPAPGGDLSRRQKRALIDSLEALKRSRGDRSDSSAAFDRIVEALGQIDDEYVERIPAARWDQLIASAQAAAPQLYDRLGGDWDKLADALLDGMIGELGDLHGNLLDPKELRALTESMKQNFFGVGMELMREPSRDPGTGELVPKLKGPIDVTLVLRDNPAEQAGMLDDDRITAVDGASVDELSVDEVVNRIKGPKDTFVTLSIERGGAPAPDVRAKRGVIRPINIYGKLVDRTAGVAYLRMAQFTDLAYGEFVAEVDRLRAAGPANALVIDLRGNPGGSLRVVAHIASEFLRKGQTVYESVQQGMWRERGLAMEDGKFASVRVAILVNERSASASEILAGALRDQGVARIVGVKTYGKGSVQTIMPIDDGTRAVKVTTGKWKTPSGASIDTPRDPKTGRKLVDAVGGIAPDAEVAMTPEWEAALMRQIGREMNRKLPGGVTIPDPVLKKAIQLLSTP